MQSVAIFEAKAKLTELVKSGHVVEITAFNANNYRRKPVGRVYFFLVCCLMAVVG